SSYTSTAQPALHSFPTRRSSDLQTKDDTIVYALQSDMQNWDPPNSVHRASIILGYHVFDHLAARDLKTSKVGPSLATAWRNLDEDRKSTRLNSSHGSISYAVFCL